MAYANPIGSTKSLLVIVESELTFACLRLFSTSLLLHPGPANRASLPCEMPNATALKGLSLLPRRDEWVSNSDRGSDPKSGSVCSCLREVLGIARQQPVGLGHSSKKYRDVRDVPNEVRVRLH